MLEQLGAEFVALRRQHQDLHRHMSAAMVTLKCAPPDAMVAADGAPANGTPGDA